MAWYPPSTFEGSDETLLNSNQTRQFFGDVSAMWINRRERERDEAERLNPGSGFPVARRIANRKYWQLGELRKYRDAQPRPDVGECSLPPRSARRLTHQHRNKGRPCSRGERPFFRACPAWECRA